MQNNNDKKYDLAFSYSGTDRDFVEPIASTLIDCGLTVFYDKFYEEEIWGENLFDYLWQVYSEQSRYMVMFISEDYLQKVWTKLEWKAAQLKLLTNSDYVWPITIGNAQIPEALKTTARLSSEGRSARQVADLIINKLKSKNCVSATNIHALAHAESDTQHSAALSNHSALPNTPEGQRDLIVIGCSNTKHSHDEQFIAKTPHPLMWIQDNHLRQTAFKTRKKIKDSILDGTVIGNEFDEGNRLDRMSNKKLINGPDFGGRDNAPVYLPAYKRYAGRCYQTKLDDWQQFIARPLEQRPDIVVVSGLYGLLGIDEYIQNYDCHITDMISTNARTLANLWMPHITQMLHERILWNKHQGYVITRIIEALAEPTLSSLFNWPKINDSASVHQLEFENISARKSLGLVGKWLNHVIIEPEILTEYPVNEFYDEPSILEGKVQIRALAH